jgi:hypothetical protein
MIGLYPTTASSQGSEEDADKLTTILRDRIFQLPDSPREKRFHHVNGTTTLAVLPSGIFSTKAPLLHPAEHRFQVPPFWHRKQERMIGAGTCYLEHLESPPRLPSRSS